VAHFAPRGVLGRSPSHFEFELAHQELLINSIVGQITAILPSREFTDVLTRKSADGELRLNAAVLVRHSQIEELKMAKKVNKTVTNKALRREYTKADVKELRAHSKAKTPVAKIAKLTKRSEGSLRQKALKLGIGLGHQR
jgi:hypothetical protein